MDIKQLRLTDTWLFEFRKKDGTHKVATVSGGIEYSRFYQLVALAYSAASVHMDNNTLCLDFYKMRCVSIAETQIYKDISATFSSVEIVDIERPIIQITNEIEIVEFKLKYS